MNFVISMNHRMKIKEIAKINKYLEFARELKMQWNIKVTVITIIVGIFEMGSKVPEKRLGKLEIRGWIKTIQTPAL